MKTKILAIATFCMALLIGIQMSVIVSNFSGYLTSPAQLELEVLGEPDRSSAKPTIRIRISYIGLSSSDPDFGSTMRYLIYNGSSETLSCIGYNGICASPDIFIREQYQSAWVCMNGSSLYTIAPGQTAELMVGPYDFIRLPRKSDEVTVGYEFTDPHGRTTQYFAESMRIPSAFRDEIRDHLAETDSL